MNVISIVTHVQINVAHVLEIVRNVTLTVKIGYTNFRIQNQEEVGQVNARLLLFLHFTW